MQTLIQLAAFAAFVLAFLLAPFLTAWHFWGRLSERWRLAILCIAVVYFLFLFFVSVRISGGGEMLLAPWI